MLHQCHSLYEQRDGSRLRQNAKTEKRLRLISLCRCGVALCRMSRSGEPVPWELGPSCLQSHQSLLFPYMFDV